MPQMTITLADRIRMYAEAVRTTAAKAKQLEVEATQALDELAKAEAEVLGKGPGWQEATLSGLIADGKNPYYEPPTPQHTGASRAAEAGVTMERPHDEEPLPEDEEGAEDEHKAKHGKGQHAVKKEQR